MITLSRDSDVMLGDRSTDSSSCSGGQRRIQRNRSRVARMVFGLLIRSLNFDPGATLTIVVANMKQTSNNACASVALLNIVNNVPSIKLGENLHAFKQFTADFSPALRGDAISNFEFVKDIHNSFARYVDPNVPLILVSYA